ncbi:hypothetical protein D3C87_2045190 [compost metagenome]
MLDYNADFLAFRAFVRYPVDFQPVLFHFPEKRHLPLGKAVDLGFQFGMHFLKCQSAREVKGYIFVF